MGIGGKEEPTDTICDFGLGVHMMCHFADVYCDFFPYLNRNYKFVQLVATFLTVGNYYYTFM